MARLSTLAVILTAALCAAADFNTTAPNSLFNILLQSFDWPVLSNRVSHWTRISNEVGKIKSAGFTGVWLPPISQSVDAQGYLPQQWYLIQGESQLRSLVSSLNSNGLIPIADVVLNHRTAPNKGSCSNDYTEFKNPDMGTWAVVANDKKCEGGVFCPGNCGCGAADTGENICYAPDLDHTNTAVQKASKDFVAWLKNNVGFKGIRWDVAKGFSPKYFGDYIAHVNPSISIGEYYDGNTQAVINWIDGTGGRSSAFDFPARFVLRDAIRANSFGALNPLPGVLRYWTEKSVTFVDNHDTTHSGDTFGNAAQIVQGNVYILTHPGTPCIYWTDWLNHQSVITSLISIRKEIGINANSKVSIQAAQGGLYAAYVDGRLAIKLGSNSWSPSSNFKLRNSGNNWAVWTN